VQLLGAERGNEDEGWGAGEEEEEEEESVRKGAQILREGMLSALAALTDMEWVFSTAELLDLSLPPGVANVLRMCCECVANVLRMC
jgi:hypothetical protein